MSGRSREETGHRASRHGVSSPYVLPSIQGSSRNRHGKRSRSICGTRASLGAVRTVACRVWSEPVSSPQDIDSKKRSEEHTSELQSRFDLVCRPLLEKKK